MKAVLRRILEISREYGHSHLPGTLSAAQIMWPIFEHFDTRRDVFILSKGHAAVALYAFLETLGYHPDLRKTHPERDPANGVTCTTGSLGHGLPMAVGIALARWIKGQCGHIYVVMGDGECLEGTTWEALCVAQRLKLAGLEVHIDGNCAGALGDLPIDVAPYLRIIFPNYVTYQVTEKGSGISFLCGSKDHKRVLTDDEYLRAMEELK